MLKPEDAEKVLITLVAQAASGGPDDGRQQ